MAITTPDAVPGAVIEAAWGDAVRADLLAHDTAIAAKVAKSGDTMTGHLSLPASPSSAAHAIRKDYADAGDNARVAVAGDVMTGNLRVGNDPTVGTGAHVRADGALINTLFADDSVHGVLSSNLTLTRAKTPVADTGGVFANFRRSGGAVSSATTLGNITIASASAVAYNTTSDKRLKRLTRPVDPADALSKVNAAEPVNFTWENAPEAGEQIGFFAQDLQPIAPEVVTPGHGEPGDTDFVPWMVDHSTLVPTLVAAIQALTARITALEEAIP